MKETCNSSLGKFAPSYKYYLDFSIAKDSEWNTQRSDLYNRTLEDRN